MTPTPTQYRSYMAPILQPLVDQGLSIRCIAQWLNQRGIFNRLGRPWYHQNVKDLIDRIGLRRNATITPSPTGSTDLSDLSDLPDWGVKTGCIADYDPKTGRGHLLTSNGALLEFHKKAICYQVMRPYPGDMAEYQVDREGRPDAVRLTRPLTESERMIDHATAEIKDPSRILPSLATRLKSTVD